jgi:hypothetical protein
MDRKKTFPEKKPNYYLMGVKGDFHGYYSLPTYTKPKEDVR